MRFSNSMEISENILENVMQNDDLMNLQLAAELGKTLLERNQELEESARRLQAIIEDQSKEIEYLTFESNRLHETNEARLRIYEALETSVGELERTNRLLQEETKTDKKRIKALCASLEIVEQHCEELQDEVCSMQDTTELYKNSQAKAAQDAAKKVHSEYTSSEDSNTDEESGILGSDESDFAGFEDTPLGLQEVLRLRSDLARVRSQISREQRMRENLSFELERSVQENARLREELLASRERERLSLNIQMDMGGPIDMSLAEQHLSVKDLQDIKDTDTETDVVENLPEQEEGTTLLYELDMQYRVLIEKYEALLEARRRDFEAEDAMSASMHSQVNSIADLGSSDESAPPSECPATKTEETSTESEPPCREVACQTEIQVLKKRSLESNHPVTVAPRSCSKLPVPEPGITVTVNNRVKQAPKTSLLSSLSDSEQETFNKHFEHTPPEYKKLFAEIFAVLKRKVSEIPACALGGTERQSSPTFTSDLGARLDCSLEKLKATVPSHVRFSRSYAEVVRARQQQAKQIRTQAQRNMALNFARYQSEN